MTTKVGFGSYQYQLVEGWPVEVGFHVRSVALADLDANGTPWIIVSSKSKQTFFATLYVLASDGSHRVGWPVTLLTTDLIAPPSSADLDLDGAPDILGSPEGYEYALHADGSLLPGWPAAKAE